MIWNSMRFVFVLLLLSVLVACGGFGTQAEPTPAPVPSSTSTALPTNTPRPTNTPLPTNTPVPTPTPTITPTPTPQIGEIRINLETGQEEVFSDPGDWVEVVKAAEVTDYEGVAEADVTWTNENGSWTAAWSIVDPEDSSKSIEYAYNYPAIEDSNLLNSNNETVPTTFEYTFREGMPFPSIRMVSDDEKEEELAWWNYQSDETNKWGGLISITEDKDGPLINLGSENPADLEKVGFVRYHEKTHDYITKDNEKIGPFNKRIIALVLMPSYAFNQKVIKVEKARGLETVVKEITWLVLKDDQGNSVIFLLKSSDSKGGNSGIFPYDELVPLSNGLIHFGHDGEPTKISDPISVHMLINTNYSPSKNYSDDELYDFLRKTKFVFAQIVLNDKKFIEEISYPTIEEKFRKWAPSYLRTWATFVLSNIYFDQQQQWFDEMAVPDENGEHTTTVDNLKIGFDYMLWYQNELPN